MGLIIASLTLVLITIYYTFSKRFGERHIGLIVVSFLQGIALAQIFRQYGLIDSLEVLTRSPIYALSYYILAVYYWNLLFVIKSSRGKTEDYKDEELLSSLGKVEEFKRFEFDLKKYSGKNSFNANIIPPLPFLSRKYNISFGGELIDRLNIGEKLFVIVHEVSHGIDRHLPKKFLLIMTSIFILSVASVFLNIFIIKNAVEFYMLFYLVYNLVFLLIGIISFNIVSWRYEYKADERALEMTNDFYSFESALLKLEEKKHTKDFGTIINLLVYSHPLNKNRIKSGKRIINTQ